MYLGKQYLVSQSSSISMISLVILFNFLFCFLYCDSNVFVGLLGLILTGLNSVIYARMTDNYYLPILNSQSDILNDGNLLTSTKH